VNIGALTATLKNESTGAENHIVLNRTLLKGKFRYGWAETVRRWQGGEINYPYNIVGIWQMAYNDLNTAIGRTRKWEYVCYDSKETVTKSGEPRTFHPVQYPFVCRELEYVQRIEEGVIYEKRFTEDCEMGKAGQLFYIGKTKDPERREQEHKRNPTNDDMALALTMPHETKSVKVMRATPRQLDDAESRMIAAAIERGETLLNKKKTKDALATVERLKTTTVACTVIMQTRFKITMDEKNCRYRIQWRDHNEKKHAKEWKWSHLITQAQALAKTEAFQKEISAAEIGVGVRA
jgi:hypothetical protein